MTSQAYARLGYSRLVPNEPRALSLPNLNFASLANLNSSLDTKIDTKSIILKTRATLLSHLEKLRLNKGSFTRAYGLKNKASLG